MALADLEVPATGAATSISQKSGQRSEPKSGQRSGPVRSSARASRSSRRKSPYDKSAAFAVSSGISPNLDGLAIAGSVTRARAKQAATLFALSAEPVARGCGGARGPIERQQQKEDKWKVKLQGSLGADPAVLPARETATTMLGKKSSSSVAPPPTSSVVDIWGDLGIGGKSVYEWRESAINGFVGDGGCGADGFAGSERRSTRRRRRRLGDGGAGATASSKTDSTTAALGRAEALPKGTGIRLPPLPGGQHASRRQRLATLANEREQRELRNRKQREDVFEPGGLGPRIGPSTLDRS